MKTIYLSMITCLFFIAPTLAENPYFPVNEKRKLTFRYLEGTAGGAITESVSDFTGEKKEVDGKTYFKSNNWVISKEGKKLYPSESLARVDKEGNIYGVNPGFKTEVLSLPSVSKLKVGYTWVTDIGKSKVTNKVISIDGKVAIKDFKMDGLLVLEQTMGEDIKMRSYLKKGVGPIAVATITKENEEKFIFHLKK